MYFILAAIPAKFTACVSEHKLDGSAIQYKVCDDCDIEEIEIDQSLKDR